MSGPGEVHPHPPAAGVPDIGMAERLEWPDRWLSADGTLWPIPTMSTGHLWNVLGYLRWFAPELAAMAGFPRAPGDVIRAWLIARPAWVGMAEELRGRGEIGRGDRSPLLALARLEASGLVPWERRN